MQIPRKDLWLRRGGEGDEGGGGGEEGGEERGRKGEERRVLNKQISPWSAGFL